LNLSDHKSGLIDKYPLLAASRSSTPKRSRISLACRVISRAIVDLDGTKSPTLALASGPEQEKQVVI